MDKHKKNKVHPSNILRGFSYDNKFEGKTTVDLIQYNAVQINKVRLDGLASVNSHLSDRQISWFKIKGFSDTMLISKICKECGIEIFDIQNIFSSRQITRFVEYSNLNFILLSNAQIVNGEPVSEQLVFILGKNYLISIQESGNDIYDNIEEALFATKTQLREKGADYLLSVLINKMYLLFVENTYQIIDSLNELEDSLLSGDYESSAVMHKLRVGKSHYLTMRRIISPIREELVNLLHNNNKLISGVNIIYFNDLDDKIRSAIADLEILNESQRSLLELYYNNNNIRMNDIIKRLTIVSTIFIPLTFIVGVWGMNFSFMPELKWEYGYFLAWGIIFLIAIISVWWLKRKKWF